MTVFKITFYCTVLIVGLRRTWCNGRMRRIDLVTFRWPYLLPHCGFPFSASQFGKSYVRKKVMQWICRRFTPPSSTALLFPTPSYTDTYIDSTSTTLTGDGSSRVSLISEFLCTVLPSRILGVRRCGWTYVASLHVHLTLRTKRCSESVVASLLHLLLPCSPGTLGG